LFFPNIPIGYYIRRYCYYYSIAIKRSRSFDQCWTWYIKTPCS